MNVAPLTYGHRHLGVWFVPLVQVTDRGFVYRGKQYQWNNVAAVDTWTAPFFINVGAARSRATVRLTDGRKIRLNCRALEKFGERPKVGFISTRTDAYDELVTLFTQAVA